MKHGVCITKTLDGTVLKKEKATTRKAQKKLRKKQPTNTFFSKTRKGLKRRPRTPWEKCYKLAWQCKQNCKDKTPLQKLNLLKGYAVKKICIPVNYTKLRNKSFPVRRPCFVCGSKATCNHHIILLIYGGFNNAINRVPICDTCHEKIHPWMKDKKLEQETKLEWELCKKRNRI